MRFIIPLLIITSCCYGQREFEVHSNGLIYDAPTMKKLGHIVDSLNLKFKTCDLSAPYYAFPQGMAALVKIPSKAALKLIKSDVPIETYLKSYPHAAIKRNIWILKYHYTDYQEEKMIKYAGLPYGYSQEPSIVVADEKANDKVSGWIVDKKNEQAFYFSKLEMKKLPLAYARLVKYVDCMIDTTTEIFFPTAKSTMRMERSSENPKIKEFMTWADEFPNQPEKPDYAEIEKRHLKSDSVYALYFSASRKWDSLRMIDLDKRMSSSTYGQNLLREAANEGIRTGNSNDQLELYAGRYLNKSTALNLMRSRKVMGFCSMDQSPRYHAMNICKLAAETAQWDIFLRSHLDIMNDRFDRMTDGSYAWGQRKTYLKELEQLDINAIDLLLGTALRVENVSDHHYWGSIGRLGRALTDATDKTQLEQRLFAMASDNSLDPFNRLLIAYLISNYAYNLSEDAEKRACLKKLETVIDGLPDYIAEAWKKGQSEEK